MRAVPIVLAVLAVIGPADGARAACRCACVEGRPVPLCAPGDVVQTICQELCTPTVSPGRVSPPPLTSRVGPSPIGGGGGGAMDAVMAGETVGAGR